jgi:hypothetical protein
MKPDAFRKDGIMSLNQGGHAIPLNGNAKFILAPGFAVHRLSGRISTQ